MSKCIYGDYFDIHHQLVTRERLDWESYKFQSLDDRYVTPASTAYYMYRIGEAFSHLDVIDLAGNWRSPSDFMWYAYSKVFKGFDDPFEGSGATPHEAIKDLYREISNYRKEQNHEQ